MKVALYTGELPPPVFIDRLIHGLAKEGVDLLLLGAIHGKVHYAYPNVKVVGYRGKWHKAWQLFYYTLLLLLKKPKAKRKLDELLQQQGTLTPLHQLKYYPVLYHQPDILHLQWAKAVGEWQWVQEFGMRLVVSARGTHLTISPKVHASYQESYTKYFPKVDAFHTVSNAMVKEVLSYGVDLQKVHTIYSGLHLKDFPFILKTNLSTPLTIVSVGRPHWVKGYAYALDALALLKQRNYSFTYTLIGVDSNEELQFLIAQSGLQEHIRLLPALSSLQILAAIQNATVLLLSSVEEGIANVVLEAMAVGTLVVTTDCGGMKEAVTDRVSGLVVPIRNPEAMAAALIEVSQLPLATYHELTTAARHTIEERFTEYQMVSGMKQLYQSLDSQS